MTAAEPAGGWRAAASGLLSVALAVGALWWATAGFTVLTSEGARRRAVQRTPVPIPTATVRTVDGASIDVLEEHGRAELRATPRTAIVAFFYARCPGICGPLGESMQRAQALIRARGLSDEVRLLSVSFDAADATPGVLARYARERRVDPTIWSVRALADSAARRALLEAFGVVVIPDGAAGFQHNAALHVVTADRRLVRIVDLDDAEAAVALATTAALPRNVASR